MSELAYNDRQARPAFYPLEEFDPQNYLRQTINEDGESEWVLDTKVKRFWFRLVYPNGKISSETEQLTDTRAVKKVRIYADRNDPADAFLSEASATRYFSEGAGSKPYQQYFLDWAETIAIGRALANAGFDLPPFTMGGLGINPVTGELLPGAQTVVGAPAAPPASQLQQTAQPQNAQPRQYSAVTAPPAQQPALAPTAPPSAPPPRQSISGNKSAEELLSGMTLDTAKQVIVNFGPADCRGHSIGEIAANAPKILEWIAERYMGPDNIARAAAQFMIKQAG